LYVSVTLLPHPLQIVPEMTYNVLNATLSLYTTTTTTLPPESRVSRKLCRYGGGSCFSCPKVYFQKTTQDCTF